MHRAFGAALIAFWVSPVGAQTPPAQPPPAPQYPPNTWIDPAPEQPAPTTPAQPPPGDGAQPPLPPPDDDLPPDAPASEWDGPRQIQIEAPPPPAPPVPRKIAPRSGFWLGARLGWFVPFGRLWSHTTNQGNGYRTAIGVPWSDYASPGPLFEIDVGARLGRHYNLFVAWERAQLGVGDRVGFSNLSTAEQSRGDTDFWGIGARASSNASRVGFVTELVVGYRRARTLFSDGASLELTDAPFAGRIGAGLDIRVSRTFSLSPLLTIGVGSFGKVRFVKADGTVVDPTGVDDRRDGHAWFTLQVGGHFDLSSDY